MYHQVRVPTVQPCYAKVRLRFELFAVTSPQGSLSPFHFVTLRSFCTNNARHLYPRSRRHRFCGAGVGVGMGHDGCEVHVFTRGGTCAQYCKGQNKKCIGGQDNRHQPGDNGCVLDPNHSRQSEAADGCNQRWNDQVCICK